jgi:hypothetical protein
MPSFFFWKILTLFLTCTCLLFSLELSQQELAIIGKRIYLNECGGKKEKLVWWNDGEHFASLGIGHFIWYPTDQTGPFEETFPQLLHFLQKQGISLPDWLKSATGCPWQNKQEYLREKRRRKELQDILANSLEIQINFIVQRFEQTIPELLVDLDDTQKRHLLCQLNRLGQSLQGKYALLDYLNFKGKGLAESERYHGEGWGLKQVLQNMPDTSDPLNAFVETAKTLLKRRVHNAPADRQEDYWLQGWLKRLDSYYLKS